MDEQNNNAISVPVVDTVTALAPYVAMGADLAQVKGVLAENLGPGGISEFDLTRIKVPSGGGVAFELSDPIKGTDVAVKFNAIIIAARDTRGYWPEGLDEKGGLPPSCHSNDCVVGTGNPGGACITCPFAQFGSETKANGDKGQGQACKQMKQLFIMREGTGSFLPEILNVPPTSLKPYRQYALQLAARMAPVYAVVTEISLQKAKSAGGVVYAQLTFKPVAPLTTTDQARVKQYSEIIKPMFEAPRAVTPANAPSTQGTAADPAF